MNGYLAYVGFSDRVLYIDPQTGLTKQGWVGFWDWDNPILPENLAEVAQDLDRNLLLYKSGKGYHILALDIQDWNQKLRWWTTWTILALGIGLEPDYILARENVLRLNAKNGEKPHLWANRYVKPQVGSAFHLNLLGAKKRDLFYFSLLEEFYPIREQTWGRIKGYSSDPNGIFEIAKGLKNCYTAPKGYAEPREDKGENGIEIEN